MQDTYADVAEDEAHFRGMQVGRYTHLYSVTLRVPNDRAISQTAVSAASLRRSAVLQIEEDAEFHITHISAAVMAPVAAGSEVRDSTLTPALPMAGVSTGRSDRGLAFRIIEPATGRRLTVGQTLRIGPNIIGPTANFQNGNWASEGYVPLEALFPPSYAFELAAPIAFEYLLERNARLVVDFLNRDSDMVAGVAQGNGGHRVTFAFLGQRYDS